MAEAVPVATPGVGKEPAFVEIAPVAVAAGDACVLELQGSGGRKLTIRLAPRSGVDLPALSASL
jgi:hypothetical protein